MSSSMSSCSHDARKRGALFLDRDGTIIADAHYLADPSGVRLIAGAAEAITLANREGVPVIVVTNQSGIARGLITDAQYAAVRDRTNELLAAQGARVDATLHCPHWPAISGACDCRKPGLGMYRQAAAELSLDLAHSAYVGDRWRDVEPALRTGGIGILVPGVESPAADVEAARSALSERLHIAHDITDAVKRALAMIRLDTLHEGASAQ